MKIETRQCPHCKEDREVSSFQIVKGRPRGRCRPCKNEYYRLKNQEFRMANPLPPKYDENGLKICPKCKTGKYKENFQLNNGRPNGWCKSCRASLEMDRRRKAGAKKKSYSRIEGGNKLCMNCMIMTPLSEFSPSGRGLGGVSAYCRPCANTRFKVDKEKARENSAKYRMKNRPEFLAMHRIRMFERNTKKRVNSDGTATPKFMKSVYACKICSYCEKYIDPEKRTADHVIPLSKGGVHGSKNIVMACSTCNSTKRDMSKDQFMEYLRGKSYKE